MIRTTDDLVEDIKQSISLPEYQARFTATNILKIADRAISGTVVPLILSANPDLLTRRQITTVAANQREYRIPYRAIGRTLRTVFYKDSAGNLADEPLRLVDPSDEGRYNNRGGDPTGLFFEGDYFVPLPAPVDGSFVITYAAQPSELIPVASAGVVDSVSFMSGDVTLDAVLSGAGTSTPLDFISGKAGFQLLGLDATPANVATNVITFALADLPTTLAANDYICLAEQTPVLPFPREINSIISIGVQIQLLTAIGDVEATGVAKALYEETFKKFIGILQPQLINARQKVEPSPTLGRLWRMRWPIRL